MANIKAKYKRYKSATEGFDTIYFKTTADQVLNVSDGKENGEWMGVLSNKYTINGQKWKAPANSTTSELTLDTDHIKLSIITGANYIKTDQTITDALKALDKAAKDAKDSIPSGVLTTGNYAAVLNSVYQAKNIELDHLSNITGSGYVKRTESGYTTFTTQNVANEIKATNTFVPKERTVNGKALSSNITLTGDDIKTTANGKNISQDIAAIREMANGRSRSFVIDTPTQSETSCNHLFRVPKTNSSISVVKIPVTGAKPLDDIQGNNIDLSTLVVGDVIFTKTAGMKDWWYAGKAVDATVQGSNIEYYWFYQLDADSITVENIFDSSSQNAISGMGVQTAINTLEATVKGGAGKYIQSISESRGKISATEASFPTSLPASNTVSTYSSTGTAPVNGVAVNQAISQKIPNSSETNRGITVLLYGTIKAPTISIAAASGQCVADESRFVDGDTISKAITARATKIFYGATQPTDVVVGDIWIDTNN